MARSFRYCDRALSIALLDEMFSLIISGHHWVERRPIQIIGPYLF